MIKRMTCCSLLAALAILPACGGAPQEPPKTAEKVEPKKVEEPKPEPVAATGPNPEAVATCLATANAKRAKFSGEPAKVTVKHVLIKYAGAKNADPSIKRTREEACMRALEAYGKLREGAEFDDVVKEFSEEPGAATRNGSIGEVTRADLAKPFADAAFELAINQVSDVVETEFGFHIIFRSQ